MTATTSPDKRYKSDFIKRSGLTVRSGKGVYIREDYHANINRIISIIHARMTRIINTIGRNSLSITDYLDNVLEQHFKDYESDINNSFRENFKSII